MSDFSTFALFTAGLAIFANGAAAQITVPGGSSPSAGAVLTPGAADIVPAGTPFTITWDYKPEGCGEKIDLALLKKVPTADYVEGIAWIARGLDNKAKSYSWTPSTSLEAGEKLYGIELVCVDTQAYQYTSRFGISNAQYSPPAQNYGSSTSAATSASAGPSSYTQQPTSAYTTTAAPSTTHKTIHSRNSTSSTAAPYPVTTGPSGNGTTSAPTGTAPITTTVVTSTSPTTSTPATTSRAPTGSAGTYKASLGGLAVAAVFAVFAL